MKESWFYFARTNLAEYYSLDVLDLITYPKPNLFVIIRLRESSFNMKGHWREGRVRGGGGEGWG